MWYIIVDYRYNEEHSRAPKLIHLSDWNLTPGFWVEEVGQEGRNRHCVTPWERLRRPSRKTETLPHEGKVADTSYLWPSFWNRIFTACKAGRKILDSISATDRIITGSHAVTIGITRSGQVSQVSCPVNRKWKMGKSSML